MREQISIRRITSADVRECARIVYEAFKGIAQRHNFPPDFPSPEPAVGLMQAFASQPAAYGVVAESQGKVIGSNFVDLRDAIAGIGPITVDPAWQGRGVGRRLMQAVLEHGRRAPSTRLVQDAFNTTSLSLYASLGLEVKEPLALMRGEPARPPSGAVQVRAMREQDLDACAALCRAIHGFDRANELRQALAMFRPVVLLRDGQVAAYATAPTFWILNHGVARSEQDMCELLLGAAGMAQEPLALLVPTRQATFFRWCLAEGLRVVKPMTLMALGQYQEPRGCFFPSVVY